MLSTLTSVVSLKKFTLVRGAEKLALVDPSRILADKHGRKGSTTSRTCREFVNFLLEYLSGELPAPERAEFERHLAKCPDCSAYLHGYHETITLGKAVFADPDHLRRSTSLKNSYR
jgi:Putative zinc-finger